MWSYRGDGDQAAPDQEHADGEEGDPEAHLGLGQPLQRPPDGEDQDTLLVQYSPWCCGVIVYFNS